MSKFLYDVIFSLIFLIFFVVIYTIDNDVIIDFRLYILITVCALGSSIYPIFFKIFFKENNLFFQEIVKLMIFLILAHGVSYIVFIFRFQLAENDYNLNILFFLSFLLTSLISTLIFYISGYLVSRYIIK